MAKQIIKEKFDWDVFIDSRNYARDRIVVHCQTEEEARQFCKMMHKHGLRWADGSSFIHDDGWYKYRERTYYSGSGTRGSIDFANIRGDIILKFRLLDFTE